MRIITTCDNCKKELKIWTFAQDRVQLARQKGDQIELTCKNCNATEKYSVDNFSAVPNRLFLTIGILTFLIGTPLIIWLTWDYTYKLSSGYAVLVVSGAFLAPVLLYGLILKNDRARVNSFNRHRLKGRQPMNHRK